ncbi:MAG: formate dehydrogenase accessory sulfurtransferase FdhD [Candidatus Electryonea clarkiae]|nr:formate dehydrogenase accessory sulfurtransferase FdhD [Candidatus Electryonea clarkiae]MDP8287563.1 formate dehydrogenase accessory sulfurtransferase FdhD [Candidatus Electryonea clarkiae]
MDNSNKHLDVIHTVKAHRISTTDPVEPPVDEEVSVIVETPLHIDVEGIETYTILCTPMDKLAMAAGFLFSEGVITSLDDLSLIEECEDDPDVVRIKLTADIPQIMDPGRNLLITSSCGVCGTEEFYKKLDALPKVDDSLRIEKKMLRSAMQDISGIQPLFDTCGGTHLVAILDSDGKIIAHAEDTGRHNALDKVVGMCLFEGVSFVGNWVVLSSRVSLEMVSKCARAGIELISAISAPTSLAIEMAERCGITLCAFVRKNRATVFTHPERIIKS